MTPATSYKRTSKPCRYTGKLAFSTMEIAKYRAEKFNTKDKGWRIRVVYRCQWCGWWHGSSMSKKEVLSWKENKQWDEAEFWIRKIELKHKNRRA